MDRSLSCPGSARVNEIVGQRERDDGYEGTYGHWLIAKRLIEELGATPPDGGLQPPQVPKYYKFPERSMWMVDLCVRHVRETIPADWALLVEVEFSYDFERWRCTGHADLVAQRPDGARIKSKDWKLGYVPVDDAEENEQVLSYLVLEKLDWPETEEAEFEIFQPRLPFDERSTKVTLVAAQLEACIVDLDRRMCLTLEKQDELDTGWKQCKWCVGVACPAIRALQRKMKYTLTAEDLAQLKQVPDDGTLADFVIDGRTLDKPLKDATEMLHDAIDKTPVIKANCGLTVSRKIQNGDISIPDPTKFREAVEIVLPERPRQDRCISWSKSSLIDEIAAARGIHKNSKDKVSASGVYEAHLKPLTTQATKRLLVIQ